MTAIQESDNARTSEDTPRRRSEETRARILEIATQEFAQKGLAGARVNEIARRARANKQLVYYYFGGKLGLYNEVLGHMIGESRQRVQAEAECETLAEKFKLMVSRGNEPAGIRWQRLLSFEALEADTEEIAREPERRGTWQRHVASVQEAQAEGEVGGELDPELLALALVSITVFPFLLPQVTKFLTGGLPTNPAFVARYQSFVEEIVARLAPQTVEEGT